MKIIRRALLDGALVVLPIGAIVLLVLGIVRRLQDAADPLAGTYAHPAVMAVVLLIVLCLVVGLFVRSTAGRYARRALEGILFEKIPGYRLARAFTSEELMVQGTRQAMQPALVTMEDGQSPALVMEKLADQRLLVFVPSSPAPMSGALFIFTPDRVVYLDVPLLPFMKALSSWGLGLQELIETRPAGDDQRPAEFRIIEAKAP